VAVHGGVRVGGTRAVDEPGIGDTAGGDLCGVAFGAEQWGKI